MQSSLDVDALIAHSAHDSLPEPWLDFAHGTISAEEAVAAMEGREPPELVERSVALFRPPSAEEEERRLEALLGAHFAAPVRRLVPRWVLAAGTALAAAALVLVILPPPRFDAGYALSLSPGYLEERDAPGPVKTVEGVTRYREGQRIELRLRPRAVVEEPVSAVAFAEAGGQHVALRSAVDVNADGVVVITGTPEALGLAVGRWRLVVVVGPPRHLPEAFEEVQTDADAPYDVVDAAIEIVAAPDPEP